MVPMRPIRIYRMMPHDNQKRCGSWTPEFIFEPCQLIALLLWCQSDIPAVLRFALGERHIAVERDEGDQRLGSRKLESIPAGWHGPACGGPAAFPSASVFELGFHLAVRPSLVVVIPEDGVCRAREHRRWIHQFKLRLPSRRGCSTFERSIPVVTEHQK